MHAAPERPDVELIRELAEPAVELAASWAQESRNRPVSAGSRRLGRILRDPNGPAFVLSFVDGVIRPEDERVAGAALRRLARAIPRAFPFPMRSLIRLAGVFGPVLPWLVVPASRRVLQRMVRQLVAPVDDRQLETALARMRRAPGSGPVRLNLNLLGEAVLGEDEAARRLDGTKRLLERPDVDYVSVKVSSIIAPHSPWAFDATVERAVQRLVPLFELAAAAPTGEKFINLDMEEYRDLDLTLAVFTRVLDRREFQRVEAGLALQAYLPDSLDALHRLQAWAAMRVGAGGAAVKVRIVKGANLLMERVDAELHGWPLATWPTKAETDAAYKAMLEYALRPEHTRAVKVGVAGHNLFDLAFAWLLAQRRGVTDRVDFEMLLGMAPEQSAVIREAVGGVLLYVPVVSTSEFDRAIAYLVRRLDEASSSENFLSAAHNLERPEVLERERDRFLASIDLVPHDVPEPRRTVSSAGNRERTGTHAAITFRNQPDSDPSVAANRATATEIHARTRDSTLGNETVAAHTIASEEALDEAVARALAAGAAWRTLGPDARAKILHRAGDALEANRARLLEIMGSECSKVLAEGDPEVSEAVDFAHFYAERGRDLERIPGASPKPVALTIVTPPWNFPLAIPAGGTLAALAAGSPVILKPARQARRTGALLADILWDAGVPEDALTFVSLTGDEQASVTPEALGQRLLSQPEVGRVILTGAYETAERFRSLRRDLPLIGETSGKNAIIVTPSADFDLAVRDIVHSAFGHAGQKCSAASLVVLVGSVAESKRFRRQLLDAAQSLTVGWPWEAESEVGPLIGPASGKALAAFTTLGSGESWVLRPERLDREGRLWRPGIRDGVQSGSAFHQTEYFAPVLGIMTVDALSEAIEIVNAVDYGLTSGLQSLDEREIAEWIDGIEAGNLYVNRGTTGAIVERQPFGGWKRSSVGPGAKAGGPNTLIPLADWSDAPHNGHMHGSPPELDSLARSALEAVRDLEPERVDWLRSALETDIDAWQAEFGRVSDVSGLAAEQNLFRYRPVPVTVRWEHSEAESAELVRVVAAGLRARSRVTVSSAAPISAPVRAWLAQHQVPSFVEDATAWHRRVRTLVDQGGRVRYIGGDPSAWAEASGGSPALTVFDGPVLTAGRIEMLAFLREQAISITAHRFGTARPRARL